MHARSLRLHAASERAAPVDGALVAARAEQGRELAQPRLPPLRRRGQHAPHQDVQEHGASRHAQVQAALLGAGRVAAGSRLARTPGRARRLALCDEA